MVVGDQLTCKNIRGVKFWRKPEIRPENTLSWVKEIPGTKLNLQVQVGLFLLDVCKKVDGMFGAECSGAHTTRDAGGDIKNIAIYLHEEKVTKEVASRQGWSFTDPRTLGYKKVAEGKLDAYLHEEEDSSVQLIIQGISTSFGSAKR